MKLMTLLTIIFFFSIDIAKAAIDMACMTEIPTTTFIAQTEKDILKIELIHHNGVKFMPIYNGVITPNDLGTLQDKASLLAYLGDHLKFEIPLSKCQKMSDYLFNCFGSVPAVDINGHQVSIWSVYTAFNNEKSFAGEYNYYQTSISLDIDGESINIPMKYGESECVKELSFIRSAINHI